MATYFDEDGKLVNEDIFNAAIAAAERPEYTPTYDDQINDLYNKIANREKFSYDINGDPLYDIYKDQYIKQGKMAMRDTMGKAAALTGGYGSSYGQQVGQQAYDAYLQDLSAVIPELYGKAYDRYRDEGDDMLNLYGLLGDQRDTEYGRYRDSMTDWERNRDYERQRETEEYNRRTAEEQEEYNRRFKEDQRDYERQLNADKLSYDRQQQAYSNLYAVIKAAGYVPTDDELATAGMSRELADALRAEYLRGITPATTGGSGGGSGGGRGGSSGSSGSGNTGSGSTDNLNIDYASIINLGQGPISAGTLADMVNSGQVKEVQKGNTISFEKNPTPTSGAKTTATGLALPFQFSLSGSSTSSNNNNNKKKSSGGGGR